MNDATKIINAPERIWLQVGDDFDPGEIDFNALIEVTWCQDKIGEFDVEYARIPPGYKHVPVMHEGRAGLTDAMMRAFYAAYEANSQRGDFERLNAGYNAMIAAAPTGDQS